MLRITLDTILGPDPAEQSKTKLSNDQLIDVLFNTESLDINATSSSGADACFRAARKQMKVGKSKGNSSRLAAQCQESMSN